MTTTTVKSTTSERMYTLYLHEGKALGCSCKARQFNIHKPCKHMLAYDAQPQQPTPLYSIICGHLVKSNVHCSCGCDA